VFDLSGPIVRSRLEPDFYKFTMGQLIWRKYRDVQVTFSLTNRTAQARLGRVIDVAELREHLDHVRALMFTTSELDYLRRTNAYQDRMFAAGYLEYLRQLRLPECEVSSRGDDLAVECSGPWSEVTCWETIVLSIVNELYYRTLLRRLPRFERQAIFAEGARRLRDKVRTLRDRPDIVFSDFGTRRRFAGSWQHFVVETLRDELNGGGAQGPFLGTSNTFAAMTAGVAPMGTSAHELPMVLAGLLDPGDADPAWLAAAQRQVLDDWWEQYGWGLSIFLPDTFGTDFFFTVATVDDLRSWKGFRWDSGSLDDFGELVIFKYEEAGVDPRTKLLVPSDALDLPVILDAQDRFGSQIRLSYGWGTGLTNDLLDNVMMDGAWFGPMSLVMKATRANGRGLVKLSDNPAKALGAPADVERYKQAASYDRHEAVAPKY
jgi:nicotinate phosphoribosyltransferase